MPKPQVRNSVQDAIELVAGRTPRSLLQLRSRVHCRGGKDTRVEGAARTNHQVVVDLSLGGAQSWLEIEAR